MNKKCLLFMLTLVSFLFSSCDNRNIKQVVKEIAEAPADTTGLVKQVVQTNAFSGVEIDCFADVTYHQTASGTEPYVELSALNEVLPHVSVKTVEDMLLISTDRRYRMPEKAVVIVNVYAPFINKFSLNGGKCIRLGNIQLYAPITVDVQGVGAITATSLKAQEIDANIDGAGSIDLKNVETSRLTASINGAGQIFLAGHAGEASVVINGAGAVDTSSLKCDKPIRKQK